MINAKVLQSIRGILVNMLQLQIMEFAIIEDHTMVAQLLGKLLLRAFPDSTIKSFSSGEDFFLEGAPAYKPDCLITDMLMPTMPGLTVVEKAKAMFGNRCKILVLTGLTDLATIKNAMRKGADGYVSKAAAFEELIFAIQSVMIENKYISPILKDKIVDEVFMNPETTLSLISPKEKEVLEKICGGKVPKEIAAEMQISINTVQYFIKNLMRKFMVNRTTELLVVAIQKGFYSPSLERKN